MGNQGVPAVYVPMQFLARSYAQSPFSCRMARKYHASSVSLALPATDPHEPLFARVRSAAQLAAHRSVRKAGREVVWAEPISEDISVRAEWAEHATSIES